MADYTPDSPYVIGNEWVPIKYDPYILNISEELGTTFEIETSSNVVSGSAYGVINDDTPGLGVMLNVYPESLVDQTGPIKQSVIQCKTAVTSGTGSFSSSSTFAGDLASAYDNLITGFNATSVQSGTLRVNFDALSHTELTDKRILKLEILFRIESAGRQVVPVQDIDYFLQNASAQFNIRSNTSAYIYATTTEIFPPDVNVETHPIQSIDIGDANVMWDLGGNPQFIYPWTAIDVSRFDSAIAAADRLSIDLVVSCDGTPIRYSIGYMALRVTYCEENRILFGGNYSQNWAVGRNLIPLRKPLTLAVGETLAPGRYAITATKYSLPTPIFPTNGDMTANGITELYPMVKQTGVVVPSTFILGTTREAAPSPHLLELALHTSSAIVTGVHPYGVQDTPAVWNGSLIQQGVFSSNNGSPTQYPVVRFYARHFPGTIDPLTVRNASNIAVSAAITVDEFDQLDEILDGWKSVTLRFPGPVPTFDGAGTLETYEWLSADSVSHQWQVLGASAPAITGSFPRTQITGPQALNAATYGGETAHLTIESVVDLTSDATILFAQEMPAVSGLAIQAHSLPVTGIGLDCDLPPDCIPTGIGYLGLTWNAFNETTMPASGFGYYELQRSDDFDDWQTILQASSPTITGFSDFEARIGKQSSYRIRFVHRLNFPSQWSATVSSTIAAPGVTGAKVSSGVLIFTTNEVQNGSKSLAYAMQWDSEITEGFTFLEAAEVQFQKMYGRDYQVAFRPLERGGSQFQRALLVQAAAVPTGLMQLGFTSLRDLAWEDVSYICVRDELGDRWLSNVGVPEGRVRRDRSLYMATVNITEVTTTPSIVTLPEPS